LNIKGEWEKLTFTGDSGAVDHVITKDAANAFELRDTAASKAGLSYRAANGSPIKNYGERKLNGVTQNGIGFNMSCQVTDVKKNLASFVKMVEENNDIVLSKKGSFIKNIESGQVIKLDLTKGTPQFDVWVKKAREVGAIARSDGIPLKNKFASLNTQGESDIKDSELSTFQRLEMYI
jgi:hypothetical protein